MEIVYDLARSLAEHLRQKLESPPPGIEQMLYFHNVVTDTGDTLKPAFIKVGRVYDPEDEGVPLAGQPMAYISIELGDATSLSDRAMPHGPIRSQGVDRETLGLGIGYPMELGGASYWWRKLTVGFVVNCVDSDNLQPDAFRLANGLRRSLEILCESAREQNPDGWDPSGVTDIYGEMAVMARVEGSSCWEGGGPEDDYIWRGQVWVWVLTVQP